MLQAPPPVPSQARYTFVLSLMTSTLTTTTTIRAVSMLVKLQDPSGVTAGHGRRWCRRDHDEEHGRVEAAELRGEVLVVRWPPLRGRAGAHHAAGAGQEPPWPWPWERRRWKLDISDRRQTSIGGGSTAPAAAAAVDVVLRRPIQLQAAQLEMQVRRGLADDGHAWIIDQSASCLAMCDDA